MKEKLEKLKAHLEFCKLNADLQVKLGKFNTEEDKYMLIGKSEGYSYSLEFIYRLFEM